MIQIRCASCEELFEVEEASVGGSEFCPACGALNDVVAQESPEQDQPSSWIPPARGPFLPTGRKGMPGAVWWLLAIVAVGMFVGAYWLAVSDDWEASHLQQMTDIANRADALWAQGDFAGAGKQYDLLITTAGNRKLHSDYLRDLVAHARQGVREAVFRQHSRPATAPAIASESSPSSVPHDDATASFQAILKFQHDSDRFSQFIQDRPVIYLDDENKWRRRRWVVWDVAYDLPQPSEPRQILLRYSCGAQRTGPHFQREEAASDIDFRYDDVGPKRCQTLFDLQKDVRIMRNEGDDQAGDAAKLKEVWGLMPEAFGAKSALESR